MKKARIYHSVAAVFLAALVLSVAGCGYTTRSMIVNRYRTIYITPFTNKINITSDVDSANKYKVSKPMIESDVTRAVVNKYLMDGNLKPIRSGEADLVLKGEVIEFRQDPLRYTTSDDVEEYRLNVIVNISMWDKKENKKLWEENGFTGYIDYYTSFAPSTITNKRTSDQATPDAINDLARRIVERTVEEW